MAGEKSEGHHGGSSIMDKLKDKLHDTKLHDLKISMIHKKSVQLGIIPSLPSRKHLTDNPSQTRSRQARQPGRTSTS